MLTVSDFVKVVRNKHDDFGIEGYRAPTRDNFYRTQDVMKWTKGKSNTYLD